MKEERILNRVLDDSHEKAEIALKKAKAQEAQKLANGYEYVKGENGVLILKKKTDA